MKSPLSSSTVAGAIMVFGILVGLSFPQMSVADTKPSPVATCQQTNFLQLTPDQQKRFTQFENNSRSKRKQLVGQIRETRKQLSAVYGQYNLDLSKANILNGQLNGVQQQLLQLHLQEQTELRKILTPRQFAKLQTVIHDHESREGGWRGQGQDHGDRAWPH